MRYVVDATVAVNWVIPYRRTPYSQKLLSSVGQLRPVAPLLLQSEVVNTLVDEVISKRMAKPDCMRAVRSFAALPIAYQSKPLSDTKLADWKLDKGVSVYDATYLELARSLKLELATEDGPLIRNLRTRHLGYLLLKI